MGVSQVVAGQRITASLINQLPAVVSYLATGSASNFTAEQVIGTFTIPADDPTFPGGYWWVVQGITGETGSPTLTVRMRFGSLTGQLLSSGVGTQTLNPGIFQFQGWIAIEAIGSSGLYGSQCTVALNFSGSPSSSIQANDGASIDTTIANNIVVTAQFNTASTSNTATTKSGSLYRL